jgi:hypothetical protein
VNALDRPRFARRDDGDESGALFPIINEGHGERLAGYGVSERLRERQRRTSFERLRHGDAV